MSKCPICDSQYTEGQADTCSTCNWYLKYELSNPYKPLSYLAQSELLQKGKAWGKDIWQQKSPDLSDEQKFQPKQVEDEFSSTKAQEKEDHNQLNLQQLIQDREQLQANLKGSNEKCANLQSQLDQVTQERDQFQSQIQPMLQLRSGLLDLLGLKPRLEAEVEKEDKPKISSKDQEDLPLPNQEYQSPNPIEPEGNSNQIIHTDNREELSEPTPQIHLISDEKDLVKCYNEDPKIFSEKGVEVVSETEDSINQRRLGTSKAILEKNRRGNYWIFMESGIEYLVPKGNFKINEHKYNTVEFLFECLDYQANKPSDFQLVKPAKVSFLPGLEKWQLEERGILQFNNNL